MSSKTMRVIPICALLTVSVCLHIVFVSHLDSLWSVECTRSYCGNLNIICTSICLCQRIAPMCNTCIHHTHSFMCWWYLHLPIAFTTILSRCMSIVINVQYLPNNTNCTNSLHQSRTSSGCTLRINWMKSCNKNFFLYSLHWISSHCIP